ncbi:protein FAM83G-like [Carassius auratus]|uniref:Protein FAM83G-like n=1 Tax=Carassius auratus TaxID=7957 RepID=A0A6P6KWP1_CARAU|nr:protein FAM83G-like [Carassius auratus]
MALSQVQCLDNNHINLRTNESKPGFFYSEQQRLALETLIEDGQDAYEDYIQTNNIRCFLSDLELQSILSTVEVYCPGSPDFNAELLGDSDGEEVSLQYWPDRSDRSIPLLDIGWPDRASYRGLTRVQVYTQPPYEGQSHIKEVVRKMISQAQKVIAIVMDLFTDIDIFKDLLDASYKRKVSVYIMLEATGVNHFLRMCEKAGMHTGHLKNMRVRSIRGTGFFSRSSKRVCGSQSQKFMFIDGDKAVSGSYSFTWSASRLDRNLITVLTGQAVDTFDSLFQDMYVMSNGVCLSKINLSSEPEPDFLPQVVPTLLPSATTALKLINPKYTLVSNCAFTSNGPASDQTSAKNSTSRNQPEVIKRIKDTPVVPPVHPGLLNLEKANMINYVPTWPDPDPPSDVIGFINIRDSNKPLQAHLMRSELFEVSQAIRFKDPLHEPKESLRDCPGPISQTTYDPETPAQKQTSGEAQEYFDQNQHQRSSQREKLISPLEKPKTVHVLACSKVNKEQLCVMEKELASISLQRKNINREKENFPNTILSFAQDDTGRKQALDTPKPLKCPAQTSEDLELKSSSSALSIKNHYESFAISETPSVMQSQDEQVINDVATHDYRDTKPDTNQNGLNGL